MSKIELPLACDRLSNPLTFEVEVHGEITVEDGDEDLVKDWDIKCTGVRLQADLHAQVQDVLLRHLQLTGSKPRETILTNQNLMPPRGIQLQDFSLLDHTHFI